MAAIFLSLSSISIAAESLTDYVNTCKSEVEFSKLPELHCVKDGLQFQQFRPTPINDYVGYKRINDSVDLTFACRWIFEETVAGAEVIVHNRRNGNTCFFSAKLKLYERDHPKPTRANARMISPTATNAADYWDSPKDVNAHVRCVNCHVAGPYIITKNIAPFMARFGLINNGHDTMGNVPKYYHAVGTTFSHWDSLVSNYIGTLESNNPLRNCAGACHALGGKSPQEMRRGLGGEPLQHAPNDFFIQIAATDGSMPPTQPDSPYRWFNMDTSNATGDYENLSKLKTEYPHLVCADSQKNSYLEAHVVGSTHIIRSDMQFSNTLNTFNLKEGLRCVNSEQPAGKKCEDYSVSYQCGDGTWTEYLNQNKADSKGDNELRSNIKDLCLNKGEPIAMKARRRIGVAEMAGSTSIVNAPNDRLNQFDSKKGLVCKNNEQIDGKCSNYVARFVCR